MKEEKNKYQHLSDTIKALGEARKSFDEYERLSKLNCDNRHVKLDRTAEAIGNAIREACYLKYGERGTLI